MGWTSENTCMENKSLTLSLQKLQKKNHKNEHSKLRKIQIMRYYLPGRRRSLISMLKKGRNKLPQKGHVVLRFESSAVQPAIISSS